MRRQTGSVAEATADVSAADIVKDNGPMTIQQPMVVQQPLTPLAMMQQAMASGLDAEQIGKWMELQERFENRRAAEVFGEALSKFQKICPTVFKGRKTKAKEGSDFAYNFAGFDDVMREVSPALAECGISIGFDTDHNLEKGILSVTCRIRVGSHFEDRKFACPVASTLKVSEAQKFGSALSYAKRYCLCAALNIVTTDHEDDDGQGTFAYITQEQVGQLNELLEQTNSDLARFLAWAQIDKLSDMQADVFPKAMDILRRKARSA